MTRKTRGEVLFLRGDLRPRPDYFANPVVRIRDVLRHVQGECLINQQTVGEQPAPGFGASDCRAGCGSHLKRLCKTV